ncbi:amino acid adenylation domain-containing protein [Kitasatospora sp. NPDC059599]|uniref:amino acid adenylation domain-containing protein n=1 Tax=Kitasatospora sp. NPDC059599 TaxID=3346880 RepID=UPI0036A9AA11
MKLIRRGATDAPLSAAQESLWFIEQAHPGTAAYNVPLLLRWNEAVDVPALRRALLRTVTRHEALRTAYRLHDGRPRQEVLPPGPTDLALHHGTARPGPAELTERARAPFDLASGRPLRCDLWQGAPEGDTLLVTLHHIAFDGWSLGTFLDDLHDGYRSALGAESPDNDTAADTAPEPDVQYADFAHWERASWGLRDVEGRSAARAEELTDADDPPLFPGRGARGTQARPGGHLAFPVPADLWERTGALATRLRATPFVVLFAAFQEVLRRWSGSTDFVVGTVMANRPKRCLEGAVGCFVNTVPLRCRPAATQTFEELCGDARTESFRALTHQDLPFDRLTALTAAKRGTGRSSLTDVAFGVQNAPMPRTAGRARWQQPELLPTGTARYDLLFLLEDHPGGVTGTIEYDLDLCTPQTAARFRDAYLALLTAAVDAPGTPLARLPLSARTPQAPVPGVLAGPARDHARAEPPADRSLLGPLAARLAEDPGAVAVSAGTDRISRGALDHWSWAVAHALAGTGTPTGAEAAVPVLAARGPALAAGWTGVLRTGRPYVPLGLDTPVERLEYILGDLGVDTVLADDAGARLLRATGADVRILDLDALRHGPTGERRAPEPAGEDTAVVIYTSGTTGRPKSVPVPHRGLANTVLWWADDSGLGPADRLLCVVGTSFDPATFETFRALVSGAELVYADDVERKDGRAMLALLRTSTVAAMTPGLLRAVLDAEDAEDAAADGARPGAGTLRMLYLGGEKLTRALAAECHARWGVPLRNVYGPTEVSCTSLCAPVTPEDPRAPAIGLPVWNTRAYVLGADGEELPAGIPGELYLAGAGVSRGYLGRPDLTATAFLPDPFAPADEPDARMYRTGDRVVIREDGLVEYLGRADEQVKILGNRIEPAEVATLIAEQHEAVLSAAVTAEGDPARLVAYVVLDASGGALTHEDVVRPLLRWLPAAVLPGTVHPVDALPMTVNDKIDFRALRSLRAEPLPRAGHRAVGADPAHRWASDRFLAALATEDRGAPAGTEQQLGPDDDFFALGGHSLLAVRMLAAVEREDGLALALGDFLTSPTVAGFAALRDAARGAHPGTGRAGGDTRPGAARAEDGRHPATPVQQRMAFLDRVAGQRAAYLAPTVVESTGADPRLLAAAVAAVVGHHPALRSRFRLDLASRQVLCTTDAPLPEVEVSDVSGLDEAALTALLTEYCWTPFDLAEQAPVRARVLTAGPRTLLVLVIHHIVADGWAQQLLLRQLGDVYRALADGREPELPAAVHPADLAAPGPADLAATDPADPAAADRAPSGADPAEALLARLRGAPTDIDLPRDRERPRSQDTSADVRRARLTAGTSAALRATLAAERATVSMAAPALLGAVLAGTGRQRDFLFAFPWAGRATVAETEAVAMLVKTLVLRVDLRDEPTWRVLLERVRDESVAGYRYADVPFETLVAALDPGRSLGRPPLTPVLVTAVMDPPAVPDLGPAAQSRQLPPPGLRIKYELELTLRDTGDRIELELAYATALFDAATAQTLLDALVRAADRLAAEPDGPALPPQPDQRAHTDRPDPGQETGEARP